jgi:GTP cyclohydrolase II
VAQDFAHEIAEGLDIRPTIAITKARLTIPEFAAGGNGVDWGVKADGDVVRAGGDIAVTKAAIDPVWYLPGIAERFQVNEDKLRHTLFEQTGGAYPELVTRPDLSVFLPPIGGMTLYMFGDPAAISDRKRTLTCRVHDECNGSDVFGSDICTCRPYLIHGIAECVKEAQAGGAGLIVYNRKEGRALGEVTKFLVYNARKRQEGGDQAATYFERTECVAGVQDARFQQLMPDVLHWLGITRIDRFVSMSNMKYDAIVGSGIDIGERVSIPAGLVPPDAQVELEAKKAAGYFTPDQVPSVNELKAVVGRKLDEF